MMLNYILILLSIISIFVMLIFMLLVKGRLDLVYEKIQSISISNNELSKKLDEELREFDRHTQDSMANNRKESIDNIIKLGAGINETIKELGSKIEKLQKEVYERLTEIHKENSKQLDKMRATVDEKLQSTLEKRLGDSFKLVSERLDVVHKGLGEMQNLAQGVGDLKKVLTNVKLRGTWGEVQLNNILNQMLSPEQFVKNVSVKSNSNDRVEFAIKMPGNDEEILLPIDSKFPIEDYQKIMEEDSKEFTKQLENRIKRDAKNIYDKYIDPPKTTDFAILFLPTEGLYAEVLRISGLFEFIQREYRVVIAGPWTLAAILNSLQLGFKTLAMQKRSSDVWKILDKVKSEFNKFGGLLEKTHKKIVEAGNVIESATKKSRTIERRLSKVELIDEDKLLLE
ncbi:MAG TPA: DNA recombination protein RmuC [Fusobacteria bacterium]|nr:DNA recombination protein RmuC [Fusobacteriota bacterium]